MEEKEILTEEKTGEVKEKKPISKITKIIIGEVIALVIVLIICRGFIFPPMSKVGEMHTVISLHSFMIGLTATIFSLFAITFRKVWKTHGKYVLIPVIFTVFGYLMIMIAQEISF